MITQSALKNTQRLYLAPDVHTRHSAGMASNNTVEIQVTADTAQAQVGLGNVNKGLADTGNSAAALQSKAAGAGQGLAQVGTGAEVANTGLGKTRAGVQSISQQLETAKTAVGGFIAAQAGLASIKEVGQIADDYANLQSRIKLATGEGQAFTTAFDGVVEVAKRTNSNLENTGTLFGKLTEAGKSAGLGTQEAINQSLRLTETVNQAVQLSGASAGASSAAVTQLIQGLQSGVLRGDEFNSVMEQAPRLAKALADGLGVTTGELRKMAEAGALSADTVIAALKGQSDTLKKEFATLPPTVGRALENLSTSWTVYIGETSKASGASETAAKAISALAANLQTVAGYLIDAGQAAAGFAALRLAQTFTGIGVAAAASATGVAVSTAATAANTVATTANTNAKLAAGAAADTAAAGVGRFAAAMATLRTFTLIGLITNFKDIGTAIGEGIAKLAGYKDKTDELAAAEKLAKQIAQENLELRERGNALLQVAINKQFDLSKAAGLSIAEFDKLTKEGATAAEAIAKIGKDFDLASVAGIKNATAVLDKLAADGKLSATQFEKAWSDALKGVDLAVFETQARAAFAGSAREAERMAQVLNGTVREAIKRTGLDFEVISGGMGKAARSAINDTTAIIAGLDGLKKQGVDTAAVLTASIGKGIATADSQKAIEAVRLQIDSLRKTLGDKVTDGLLDQAKTKALELADALAKATPGINSLREAMQQLGITSDESLRNTAKVSKEAYDTMRESGKASARELGLGFVKAAQDAIEANKGIAPSWVTAEAGARGYELAVDAAGKTTVKAMAAGGEAVDTLRSKVQAATQDFEKQAAALDAINAKYSRPGEGKSNSVLTKDELKPVDNTGLDALRAKSQAGTLGKDDLATAEAAFKAAAANLEVFQKNSFTFSTEGARSIQESYAAAKAILDKLKSLPLDGGKAGSATPAAAPSAPNASPSPAPAPSTRLPIRTVNINLTGAGGTETVPTTEAGAEALLRVLQNARLSA